MRLLEGRQSEASKTPTRIRPKLRERAARLAWEPEQAWATLWLEVLVHATDHL